MIKRKRPFDISQITEQLFISEKPMSQDVEKINDLGIDLVIHMIWQRPTSGLKKPPFKMVEMITVDTPLTPLPIKKLDRGVRAALPVIDCGGKVLVYCKRGVHRSVAMMTCILIAKGMTSGDAMKLIKSKRSIAKPETSYIKKRIIKFEKYWNEKAKTQRTKG